MIYPNCVVPTTDDWTRDATIWLVERAWKYNAQSMYLPAGDTPRKLYASWREAPPRLLKSITLLQLDDVADGDKEGIFARYFAELLPHNRVRPPTKDIQADLAIVGLGMNGHVAFHEPGVPHDFRFGEVSLSAETTYHLKVAPWTKGRTFGLGAIMKTKAVLMLAIGEHKRTILARTLSGDKDLPAAALLAHPDLKILTDIPVNLSHRS